jgi:hypothetical protein
MSDPSNKKKAAQLKRPAAPQTLRRSPPARADAPTPAANVTRLQRQVGNRAVQRLLVQREGEGVATVKPSTEARIERARGTGHPLDGSVQTKLGAAFGQDFSGVRVHDSPEADTLNRDLGARAFTTGQDVFFRSEEYRPQTDEGQTLIAHELTHVVQQGGGNPAERPAAQREAIPEEDEALQTKALQREVIPEEDEALQTKALQREAKPEEEEELQMKRKR